MAFIGPYQIYTIDGVATVARVEDWNTLATSVNTGLAQAVDNARACTDAETAELTQFIASTYVPISRGNLASGTDLNTITGPEHSGSWGMPSGNMYTNSPTLTTSGVLEVVRGLGNLTLVQRITAGSPMWWREVTSISGGTWSAWVQAETAANSAANLATANAYTDTKDTSNRAAWASADAATHATAQDYADDAVAPEAAKNVTQDGRLDDLEALALPVSNIALDTDGVPYYSPGSTSVQIIQDVDGTPYFIQFMTAAVDVDGVPYFA